MAEHNLSGGVLAESRFSWDCWPCVCNHSVNDHRDGRCFGQMMTCACPCYQPATKYLEIPRVPPSPNVLLGRHWKRKNRERKTWMDELLAAWGGPGPIPINKMTRVRVSFTVHNSKLYDPDNLRFMVKPVLDAMKLRGILVDDNKKWLDLDDPEMVKCPRGKGRTTIRVRPDYILPAQAPECLTELIRLRSLLNTPEIEDFDKGVPLEAAHQVGRWGAEHDAGKEPEDWFWLVGYLAGKALRAHLAGDLDKAKHHCVSTAAVLRNWHAHIRAGHSEMRPGIAEPKT